MKKLLLLSVCAFALVPGLIAQDGGQGTIVLSSEGGDVTVTPAESNPRGFTIALAGYEIGFSGSDSGFDVPRSHHKKKKTSGYKGKLAVIDFGFNALTSVKYKLPDGVPPYNTGTTGEQFLDLRNGKSIYVAVNPFRTSAAITRDGTLGFTAGIGLVWRNYSFDNPITLRKEAGRVAPVDLNPEGFKKSKLTTFAVDIPVTLDVNFGKFFVSGGLYGGVVLGSHTKYKKPKTKSRSGNYLELFEYGVTARAGFRHFYLFGNYGLNDMFQSGKGPQTKTYTLGFSVPF